MVNYILVCLIVFLMVLCVGCFGLLRFVGKYGNWYVSFNLGYLEFVLVGILNCCFGGFYVYFGEIVYKFFIGDKDWFIYI